jgi:hypothetical protein
VSYFILSEYKKGGILEWHSVRRCCLSVFQGILLDSSWLFHHRELPGWIEALFPCEDSLKYFQASFNGKPQAAAFRGSGRVCGSPLNDLFQTSTSAIDHKPDAVQSGRLSPPFASQQLPRLVLTTSGESASPGARIKGHARIKGTFFLLQK